MQNIIVYIIFLKYNVFINFVVHVYVVGVICIG